MPPKVISSLICKCLFPLQFCYAYLVLLTQPLYETLLLTTKATSSQVRNYKFSNRRDLTQLYVHFCRPLWSLCLFYDSECASLSQWTLYSTSSNFVAHGFWLQRHVSYDYSISYPFGLHIHSFYHHLVRPKDGQLHHRYRERVWSKLLGHYLGKIVGSFGLVCIWSLLGLGHESPDHTTLW